MRIGALVGALAVVSTPAAGFPDGPPWERAAWGCAKCHFQAAPALDSPALALAGLPARFTAGSVYELTVRLSDADMLTAGFLLSADNGVFAAADGRSEARGSQARQTAAGTTLTGDGAAAWRVLWSAPADAAAVTFEVWANGADDDASPLGDRTYRRVWTVGR